jgi:uncharacterized protein YcbX
VSATVTAIYRYPVKGLSPAPLERVALERGRCLPHDRRYALARAGTRFDPAHPQWLHKTAFFMLMRDERLALLRTRFDEASGMFSIARDGRELLAARITDHEGRRTIEAFFREFLADCAPDGPPRIVEAPGHTFADAKRKPGAAFEQYVSFVNLASVAALEAAAATAVNPLRFRANVYLTGVPAWGELEWIGRELAIDGVRLRVVAPITRCAATNVDPASAKRDMEIPATLQRVFRHNFMGVYGEVTAGGELAVGCAVTVK